MAQATLYAPAISCSHCVMAIKRAVSKIEGVASVDGDPDTKRVVVDYDPARVDVERIEATMAEEGYPVEK